MDGRKLLEDSSCPNFFDPGTNADVLRLLFGLLPIRAQYALAMTQKPLYRFYLGAEYFRPVFYARPIITWDGEKTGRSALFSDPDSRREGDEEITHIFRPKYYVEYLLYTSLVYHAQSGKGADNIHEYKEGRLVSIHSNTIDFTPIGNRPEILRLVDNKYEHKGMVIYGYTGHRLADVFNPQLKLEMCSVNSASTHDDFDNEDAGEFSVVYANCTLKIRGKLVSKSFDFRGLAEPKVVKIRGMSLQGSLGKFPATKELKLARCELSMIKICPNIKKLTLVHPILTGLDKLGACRELKVLTLKGPMDDFVDFVSLIRDITHELRRVNIILFSDWEADVMCALHNPPKDKIKVYELNTYIGTQDGKSFRRCPNGGQFLQSINKCFDYEYLEYFDTLRSMCDLNEHDER